MSANTLAVEAVAKKGAIPTPPSQDSVLAALTKFIPTESLTLYIAALSAQISLAQLVSWISPIFIFWFFVVLTPILMLLIYLGQLNTAHGKIESILDIPWWRMIASTIAFLVWAIAVPGNPILSQDNAAGGVVAGLAAIVVSTVLNLLSPLFDMRQR
jgi:hypothetical protein